MARYAGGCSCGSIDKLGALAVGSVPAPVTLAGAAAESLGPDARDVVSIVALIGRPNVCKTGPPSIGTTTALSR